MECYVLNEDYEQETVFDDWYSFIWTERFSDVSSFKIEMPVTNANKKLMKENAILMISESDQPMFIETTYTKKQADGSKRYVAEGRDLTAWLELRQAPWDTSYTGYRVSEIAIAIIRKVIISGDDNDRIPDVSLTNIANDTAKLDYETTTENLLENVQSILNDNYCAIRADRIRVSNHYEFRYRIYNGTRRNVQFSDRNDTLINTQRISSSKKLRNVAIVSYKESNKEDAKTLFRTVYSNSGNPNRSGLSRRVMRVDATNVNPNDYPGSRIFTLLDRMGRAALRKQRRVDAVDGEVPDYSPYTYGKDYKLGDIVKFRADDGESTDAVISEYSWTIDNQQGFRHYPTIEVREDITV